LTPAQIRTWSEIATQAQGFPLPATREDAINQLVRVTVESNMDIIRGLQLIEAVQVLQHGLTQRQLDLQNMFLAMYNNLEPTENYHRLMTDIRHGL
jgi:hypothetical protein